MFVLLRPQAVVKLWKKKKHEKMKKKCFKPIIMHFWKEKKNHQFVLPQTYISTTRLQSLYMSMVERMWNTTDCDFDLSNACSIEILAYTFKLTHIKHEVFKVPSHSIVLSENSGFVSIFLFHQQFSFHFEFLTTARAV